jgi:ADP-glucose pyrophosphorylase
VVIDSSKGDSSGPVLHYVDKPTTFVSNMISCGIYLLRGNTLGDHLEMANKLAKERDANNGKFTEYK